MTNKMLNDIIGAYIVFGSQFSDMLDGSYTHLDDTLDNVSRIRSGVLSKQIILDLIDETHSLPCHDSLYDYMEDSSRDWLFDVNNEWFDLVSKIKSL
jgi:hypothetical protein